MSSSLSLLALDFGSKVGGTGLKVSPDRALAGLGVEEENFGRFREGREVEDTGSGGSVAEGSPSCPVEGVTSGATCLPAYIME